MKPPRILIPPGIGDSYWVLVTLPAFLKDKGFDRPELTVVCEPSPSGSRSIPFLQLFDFFTIGNPPTVAINHELKDLWQEAYVGPGRVAFPNVQGYDWLLTYNGYLGQGGYLEDGPLACDWYPKMSRMDEIAFRASSFRRRNGPYAVLFWPFYGTYAQYEEKFPISAIAVTLRRFLAQSGLTGIFTGAHWEAALNPRLTELTALLPDCQNYVGQTTLIDFFGLLRGATIVIGYQAGPLMMAAWLGTKVLSIWHRGQFHDNMRWACVPPDRRGTNYEAIDTDELSAERFLTALTALHNRIL